MKKREIFFCNITVLNGKKKEYIEKVVLLEDVVFYKNLKKFKQPVEIIKRDIICSLGFESKSKSYTEVIKSNEKRNDITGAYE